MKPCYRRSLATRATLTLVLLVFSVWAQAQTFTTLYNFPSFPDDGAGPGAAVVQDRYGNLHGTTTGGGSGDAGTVFELTSGGTEIGLYSFPLGLPEDGLYPYTPVILDSQGNIYGTTEYGGNSDNCYLGCGIVFELGGGGEKVLYTFVGEYYDGCYPGQGLVMDRKGDLYGTTSSCGSSNHGTIFKIDTAGNFSVVHNFGGGSSDGANPGNGRLRIDKKGNLYGVTAWGGANNYGVLYKLSKSGTLTVLHSFAGGTSDGCRPQGSVTMDEAGNFYGTTYQCGLSGYGTIWKVSKAGTETILHNFSFTSSDGCSPVAGVALDPKGNVYGDTLGCGANNWGVVYEFSSGGVFSLLHSFDYWDGGSPYGEVFRRGNGTLYGTTELGGTYRYGTVWKYVP